MFVLAVISCWLLKKDDNINRSILKSFYGTYNISKKIFPFKWSKKKLEIFLRQNGVDIEIYKYFCTSVRQMMKLV